MKSLACSLAFRVALALPLASQAVEPSGNPIARGRVAFEPCKNHYILSTPCAPIPSWQATTDMHEKRWRHTATLLNDGTVLVAGGGVASVELYDPRDRSWTTVGALSDALADHTAVLLPSGKVLVLGDNTAEIYDPATRQWASAHALQIPRAGFTATVLDTGKVLVVGGVDSHDGTVTAAELYDPQTDSWSFTGHSNGLFWHTATKLRDGRVLITGGTLDDWLAQPVDLAQLYDPAGGTFVSAGHMQSPRAMHGAVLLDDGSVLITGGFIKGYPPGDYCTFATLASAERYDPSAGAWSPAGAMHEPRMGHTATLLADGSALLTGGDQTAGDCPNVSYATNGNSEVFLPNSTTGSHEVPMQSPRTDHTATLLPDGSVLVVGGRQSWNDASLYSMKSAELYRFIPVR